MKFLNIILFMVPHNLCLVHGFSLLFKFKLIKELLYDKNVCKFIYKRVFFLPEKKVTNNKSGFQIYFKHKLTKNIFLYIISKR